MADDKTKSDQVRALREKAFEKTSLKAGKGSKRIKGKIVGSKLASVKMKGRSK